MESTEPRKNSVKPRSKGVPPPIELQPINTQYAHQQNTSKNQPIEMLPIDFGIMKKPRQDDIKILLIGIAIGIVISALILQLIL